MEKSKITKDGLEKKRNFIRYVIKVINKSRHCNDTKWMKNKMWASCRGKKVKNNRTKSHSSIVLLSEQNKHESFSVLMITRWSFYLDVFFFISKNKFIALSDIESCFEIELRFLCHRIETHDYYWYFEQASRPQPPPHGSMWIQFANEVFFSITI